MTITSLRSKFTFVFALAVVSLSTFPPTPRRLHHNVPKAHGIYHI